jgi:hypothetical protein
LVYRLIRSAEFEDGPVGHIVRLCGRESQYSDFVVKDCLNALLFDELVASQYYRSVCPSLLKYFMKIS